MHFENVVLRQSLREPQWNQRRTMADGLDVLATDTTFKHGDTARVAVQEMELADKSVVWLVALVFEDAALRKRAIVPLSTAVAFKAIKPGGSIKQRYSIERLADASVGYDGLVLTSDECRLRAVELEAAKLPCELSELDWQIIRVTLSIIKGSRERCYRDLRDDLPPDGRAGLPRMEALDFSKLDEREGQPALQVPMLKQIQGKFEKTFPHKSPPSAQAIANALAKCGIRVARDRPRFF